MRKIILASVLSIAFAISVTSCKKLLKSIFQSFETTTGEITMSIPVIPSSNISGYLGSKTMYYNLDSMIRARTNGNFSIDDVSSVKVKRFDMTVVNGDQNNNISNLQTLLIEMSSNSNSTPSTIASANIPDVTTNILSIDVPSQPDILTFLKGTQIKYDFSGQVRRATSHPLDVSVAVTVVVK